MTNITFGITAALAAPLAMTLGFVLWDKHWSGSAFALNMFKCTLASPIFLVASFATPDHFDPQVFTARNVGFLILSSALGILVGDWTWLEGLQLIGARRVILVDTLKPFLAALLGWTFLGEVLPPEAFAGMALTVFGVMWVSLEKEKGKDAETEWEETGEEGSEEESTRDSDSQEELSSREDLQDEPERTELEGESNESTHENQVKERQWAKGYLFAILNVVLDTFGSLLTKQYGEGMTTWEINLIRFGFASVIMLTLSSVLRARDRTRQLSSSKDKLPIRHQKENDAGEAGETTWYRLPCMSRSSWCHICLGVLLVTFLTPSLSNYALFQIALAVALTLGSVGPLYALPLTWILQNEKPTQRGTLGACLAVGGIVVLSFLGTRDS